MKIDPFNLQITPETIDTLRTLKINTGVFQLGSNKKTAHFCHGYKKLDSVHEVINLNALIRPSCMDVVLEDGKTVAEHYIMRLNGEEEVTYDHPKLESITKDSFGLRYFCIFQKVLVKKQWRRGYH